jgi:hypothetical protein
VAVPHRGDVVVAIEVATPVDVEEPDPFTAHEMDGLVVEELVGGSKCLASALQEFVFVHGLHPFAFLSRSSESAPEIPGAFEA